MKHNHMVPQSKLYDQAHSRSFTFIPPLPHPPGKRLPDGFWFTFHCFFLKMQAEKTFRIALILHQR